MRLLPVLVLVASAAHAQLQASASVQTVPLASGANAAIDTAIWLHPTDLTKSLVFGTDQNLGAVISYGLDGQVRQTLNLGLTVGVDTKYRINVSGVNHDVVMALSLDGAYRLLTPDRDGGFLTPIDNGATATLNNASAGALHAPRASGQLSIFVADTVNKVRHFRTASSNGKLISTLERTLTLPGKVEGIGVDDLNELMFLTVQNKGLYAMQTPVDGIVTPYLMESVDAGHLEGASGVTVYPTADGGAYVIVSASATSTYSVYGIKSDLPPALQFLTTFKLVASDAGYGATGSKGIQVATLGLGPAFPKGLFVAHDPNNAAGPNYKLVRWDDIASPPLSVDQRMDPRTWAILNIDAGKPDAGVVDAGPELPICPAPPDAGPSDGGDAGEVDAGPPVDAGPCKPAGTGGGGGSSMGTGGGIPPIGGSGGGGNGLEEPKGCSCSAGGFLPLAALAFLLMRRRRD